MIEAITDTGERREMTINMGPQHPSTHGVLRLELVLDGEVIKDVKPHIGYLHRCFEKYAEEMDDYAKVIPYTDRMDYVAAMNQEHGYIIGVERLLELEVPERVEYIRVIMAELQRIASHLLGIGAFGLDLGAFTPFLYLFTEREKILDIFEKASGARLLYNYMAVAGLMRDVHPEFKEEVADFVKTFRPKIKELDDLLSYNKIFIRRTANIGVVPDKVALNYAASVLNDPGKLLVVFPQGQFQSLHQHPLTFEKGWFRIIQKAQPDIQIVFMAALTDYFSSPRPGLDIYLESAAPGNIYNPTNEPKPDHSTSPLTVQDTHKNHLLSDAKAIETAFNAFHKKAIGLQDMGI